MQFYIIMSCILIVIPVRVGFEQANYQYTEGSDTPTNIYISHTGASDVVVSMYHNSALYGESALSA